MATISPIHVTAQERTRLLRLVLPDRIVALGMVEAMADAPGRRGRNNPRARPGSGSPGVSPP
jgi:hypothetical protein